MQNFGARARVAIATTMLFGWAALAYACTVEDENPGTTRVRDGGVETGTIDPASADATPTGAPICAKYNDYANVKTIADGILTRVTADCRIGGPIATLSATDKQHLTECFEIQLGGAFQCPNVTYVANTTADSKGQKCRDMTASHKGLSLRTADFNAFVEDVSAELAARGLSQDDIRALAPVFEGTRTGVVQNNTQPTRNTHCTCADGLYMGQPCLPDAGVADSGNETGPTDSGDAG